MKKKVVLISGASSGIGYATAEYLSRQGHKVYGAARRTDRIEPLASLGVTPIKLDVTDPESIRQAVELIMEQEKRIDVLVNNAGYGSLGTFEDVEIEEARRQMDVNVFGLAALTKAVIPIMRSQHEGRIVNVSSVAGRFSTAFGGWYCASKYAVEALSDALRKEVRGMGIRVSLIEPGGIHTDWGLIAADHIEDSSKGGVYETAAQKMAGLLRWAYSGNILSNPKVIAKAISRATNSHRPKARYLVGFMSRTLVVMPRITPTRLKDRIMRSLLKL